MSAARVIFDPLLPWPLVWGLAALVALVLALAAWRGARGWPLRALALVALLGALCGPALQTEERRPLGDILVAVVDESASQGLSDRRVQTAAALARLEAEAAAAGLSLHVVPLGDGADNRGTLAMSALAQALTDVPRDRVAAMVLISDGILHDIEATPELPAPLHLLQSGRATDWDRRLRVTAAPAFAILGEEQVIRLRIEDTGAAGSAGMVRLEIGVGGEPAITHEVPVGRDLELPNLTQAPQPRRDRVTSDSRIVLQGAHIRCRSCRARQAQFR